jgi:hypothetical protein
VPKSGPACFPDVPDPSVTTKVPTFPSSWPFSTLEQHYPHARKRGCIWSLPRAMATALENRKPFDQRWQQGGSWKPLTAKSAQAARNYTRGRASNASRRWPRRSDC